MNAEKYRKVEHSAEQENHSGVLIEKSFISSPIKNKGFLIGNISKILKPFFRGQIACHMIPGLLKQGISSPTPDPDVLISTCRGKIVFVGTHSQLIDFSIMLQLSQRATSCHIPQMNNMVGTCRNNKATSRAKN